MSKKLCYILSGFLFAVFVAFTVIVKFVDVAQIGVDGTEVGLAGVNGFFLRNIQPSKLWNVISTVILILAFACVALLCGVAIWQWTKRKSLKKVDKVFFVLIAFYAVLAVLYLIFNFIHINYRPILVDGELENSYPSSHVLITTFLLFSSVFVLHTIVKNKNIKIVCDVLTSALIVFGVISRMLSGFHWFTDVCGALILAGALSLLFVAITKTFCKKENEKIEGQNDSEKAKNE